MIRIVSPKTILFHRYTLHNKQLYTFNTKQVPREIFQPTQTKFQIIDKEKINHDCYIYRFKFNGPKFPLKVGQHFKIKTDILTIDFPKGQQIFRYYTPITSCKDFSNDKIQVLIKIYRPNQDPLFPKGGIFTPYLEKLNIGDEIDVEGPFGKFTYQSPGKVQISKNLISRTKKVYEIKKLFFIAGGTGITPIYQTLTEIAKIPQDKTQMTLLFCNKTEKDIILKRELEALQPRLKLHFMLENTSPGWRGLQGRPSLDVLNQIHPLNQQQTFYLYCGPPGMNTAITKIFQANYPSANYHKI